jgi:class 3 adenylate cyclase
MTQTLTAGREAIRRNEWEEAIAAFTAADLEEGLSPDDLGLLGDAYWWNGEPDKATETMERAFGELVQEGRTADAAYTGVMLAYFALRRQAMSVVGGWMSRVERLLEDVPEESLGHAFLKLMHVSAAIYMEGDLEKALVLADETIESARRVGARGAEAMATSFKGVALIYKGEWREGIALVDEATVIASSAGDLRNMCDVYCNTIAACRSIADYKRAGEWTEEAERWMHARGVGGYPGICKVHRAELKRLHGSWPEAEAEARRACVELERFHIFDGIGFAQYEIGEVRRRMGDFAAAEEAFLRAYEFGHPAQPGLALLALDRGEVDEAAESITRALSAASSDGGSDRLTRGFLLPAQVEIALAAGDLDTARSAVEELEEITAVYENRAWEATTLTCRGALLLKEGKVEQSVSALKKAWRLWMEIELPYEAAKARVLLAQALEASGDERAARLEFRAARSAFEQLGAIHELKQIDALTGETASRPAGAEVSKAMMFTDIVTSTDLIGLIGDRAWEKLLDWHDRALRDIFSHHGAEEVKHTGDGFFVVYDRPRDAIECAVAIQRRLVSHREQHGFAPSVRIGLHHAAATRKPGDYAGQGVHAAARIRDIAGAEEIVASKNLLEEVGSIPYPLGEPRVVELKGISDPVEVRSIDWRR